MKKNHIKKHKIKNVLDQNFCVLLLFLMLNHITKARQEHEHNKKKLFKIIPQDDELSLHFQRQYCPP